MTKKAKFLRRLNEAFSKNNTAYVVKQMTDDIRWTIIGDRTVVGKEAFIAALSEMAADKPLKLTIKNIITHGDSAAVEGTMKTEDGKTYAFCDVYKFRGFKNPRIKEMTSYVLEVRE